MENKLLRKKRMEVFGFLGERPDIFARQARELRVCSIVHHGIKLWVSPSAVLVLVLPYPTTIHSVGTNAWPSRELRKICGMLGRPAAAGTKTMLGLIMPGRGFKIQRGLYFFRHIYERRIINACFTSHPISSSAVSSYQLMLAIRYSNYFTYVYSSWSMPLFRLLITSFTSGSF